MTIAASGAAVARGAPESVEQNKAIGCRGTTAKSRAYYHEGMLRSLLLALLSTAATSGAFAPRLPVAAAVTARDTGGKSWTLLSPDAHQFDLILNSSQLGEDLCAELITQAAKGQAARR